MMSKQNCQNRMSYWQLIFSQSKVNGAPYNDDDLPFLKWNWPRDTFLQRRRLLGELATSVGSNHSSLSEYREGAGS
ncbi:MAG: hypothetical protein ACM3SP_23445 [Chloroflexota bacterium]